MEENQKYFLPYALDLIDLLHRGAFSQFLIGFITAIVVNPPERKLV